MANPCDKMPRDTMSHSSAHWLTVPSLKRPSYKKIGRRSDTMAQVSHATVLISGTQRFPAPAFTALVVSAALHVAAVVYVAPLHVTRARPNAFRSIEVALMAPPVARPAETPPSPRRRRVQPEQAPAPKTSKPDTISREPVERAEPATPLPPDDATDGHGERDEPLVAARFEVAALNNPKPPYPLAARRRGYQGKVLVRAHVLADGRCARVLLKETSGYDLLDNAALKTVRRWRFVPARRGDIAIDSWVDVPIAFRLKT